MKQETDSENQKKTNQQADSKDSKKSDVDPCVDKPPTREKLIRDAEKSIVVFLIIGLSLGLIGVIGFPFTIKNLLGSLFFMGLLVSFAAFVAGFFTGTLFGIPKRNNDGKSDYTLNNSLSEIADWLTKIIVGLGLVNLKQIPIYLQNMGLYINNRIDPKSESISVFFICIIIYFSVLGLYLGYNYMRLVLSLKYKSADADLMEELKEQVKQKDEEVKVKTEQVKELKTKTEIFKQATNELSNLISPEEIAISTMAAAANDAKNNYIKEMIERAAKKLKEGLKRNEKIDDPQKNMWGGDDEVNGRKLTAKVTQISKGNYLSQVELISTDPNNPLVDGEVVLFALHNSWNPAYRLKEIKNGKAELTLYSYGSFTIGVFADQGKTELELDLGDLPGVPQYFRDN